MGWKEEVTLDRQSSKLTTFGPSTNKNKSDSITSFGDFARCFLDLFFKFAVPINSGTIVMDATSLLPIATKL